MAEPTKNGTGTAQDKAAPAAIQARMVSQYIKDLSFENPNIRKLLSSPGDAPNLNVEVSVAAEKVEGDLFESSIQFKGMAVNNIGTIYVLETVYAGIFKIESVPEQALEPFLLISGPTMLFPFLRRLVADITREGGFPPLMLDPIDFASLYFRRKQEEEAEKGKTVA